MRISLTSDWHFEFTDTMDMVKAMDSVNSLDCDLNIVAGDVHSNFLLRDYFEKEVKNCFLIKGNHDYYRDTIHNHQKVLDFQGIKVLGCTLWTNFNEGDPRTERAFKTGMVDPRYIKSHDSLVEEIKKINKQNFEMIMDQQPDIVVTHHCPTLRSIHEKFKESGLMNYCFSNDYEKYLTDTKIKYWLFGHTHWRHEYIIGNTHFICNPRGYPNEIKGDYLPRVIEL